MAAKTIRKRARRKKKADNFLTPLTREEAIKLMRWPGGKRVTPEGANNKQITDYLRAHGIRFRRNQVGEAHYGDRRIPYGEKGMADWTAFVPVPNVPRAFYVLNIETKAENGKQRPNQIRWQAECEHNGEFYLLAKSYEPIEAFLKERGVIR